MANKSHRPGAPADANRREEALAKYMLSSASGALGELAETLEDLDNDAAARGRVALAMAYLGASWKRAAEVAHLPTPDAARMAAKRAATEWRNDDTELSRTLLLMQSGALFQAAMTSFQDTKSAAFLRVAERAIGRQQALIPGLAVQRQEVIVRQGEPEASPYTRPEYGPGRTWYDHVRDGLPFDQLHPDDVRRMRLTPARCDELREIWAREAEVEQARLIEIR